MAQLAGADFSSTDLEAADFSGADLDGAKFAAAYPKFPPNFAKALGVPDGYGAFVRNANFKEAKHLNDQSRKYLCEWGGLNVPGGCSGIAVALKLLSTQRTDLSGGSGSCF
jgi:Pentapeptide repeats (8 copies)